MFDGLGRARIHAAWPAHPDFANARREVRAGDTSVGEPGEMRAQEGIVENGWLAPALCPWRVPDAEGFWPAPVGIESGIAFEEEFIQAAG